MGFSVKGQWNMGFGAADAAFTSRYQDSQGRRHKGDTTDTFCARLRLLLQRDSQVPKTSPAR